MAKAIGAVDWMDWYTSTFSGTIENSGKLEEFVKEVHKNNINGVTPVSSVVSEAKINSNWSDYTIEWDNITLWIKLKRESDWKFNVDNPHDVDNIAKAIFEWSINTNMISEFSEDLTKEIRKYFDEDWKLLTKVSSSEWKLPDEVDENK
jgi:hypothetical protein